MPSDRLRVFHATDLTPESTQAFAHALRIAICGDSKLTLLHVGELNDEMRWDDFPSPTELLERWDMLPEGSGDSKEAGVDVVRVEARSNDVVASILKYLDDAPADLIVLATQGRKGFDAWFSGSVAEPIARVSAAMTLFVRHGCSNFVSIDTGEVKLEHILVPVVLKPSPIHALRVAHSLPSALGIPDARITACYVGDAEDVPLVGDVPLVIRAGSVAEEIVALATEEDVDLIVMTTEGRHGILDAFRGSTTEQVLRSAPCPVLAVPAVTA